MTEEENKKALKYALNILNRKDYTVFEMVNKLTAKGFNKDIIDNAIAYLKSNNFLNDERYAENFIYFKLKNGYGRKRIEYDLSKKGIEKNIIEQYTNNIDETHYARLIFETKIKQLKKDKNVKAKMYNFLARRGFDYDIINRIINEEGQI